MVGGKDSHTPKVVLMIKIFLLPALILFFCLSGLSHAEKDEEKAFQEAYQRYSQAIEQGDSKRALKEARRTFDLGLDVLDPEGESLLAVTDNYAALLLKTGDAKGALASYNQLLELNERVFGLYAKSLVPILEVMYKIQVDQGDKAAKATKQRYYKLLYRHNASEIAKTIDESGLPRNARAEEVQADVQERMAQSFDALETEHWTIFYNGGNKEGAEVFRKQVELAYKSVREFLVAAGLSSKPLEQKMIAVLFETEEEYMDYLERKDFLIRGTGSYNEDSGVLLFHDEKSKRSEWQFFQKANFVTREVVQQVMVAANVFVPQRRHYPLWFYDGLAYSFEFNEIDKPFGPHTENLSASNWSRAQDLIDNGGWLTIEELVRLDNLQEKEKSNKEVLYIMGTYLVRFLYEERGDEFNQYLMLLPRQKIQAQKSMYREKTFRKAFGDPKDLQKDWRRFISGFGIDLKS